MKYTRSNPGALTYIWDSREVGAQCVNYRYARMLPHESHRFAAMERDKLAREEFHGVVFTIEGMQ